jgi:nitrilase
MSSSSPGRSVVAALQLGSIPSNAAATLERMLSFEAEIANAGAQLVVLPEALLGGYPKGSDFGTRLGYRLPAGRDSFAEYYANAIDVPGRETKAIAELARRTGASIVIGVIERGQATLYCTALFFTPEDGLVAKHRKLMPTAAERLIWGMGDGSTMPVVSTAAGRIGAAICWENHMPLLRTAMYAKGLDIWCAPTVDDRDIWQSSMRHIAHEGRCFLISACQVLGTPDETGSIATGWERDRPLIRGGSVIVGPLGDVLAGPLYNAEGLVTAEIDLGEIARARFDFDPVGHYARPDVFSLHVDDRPKQAVTFDGA